MEGLFGKTKYIPRDEADLARHILMTVPFAKENPDLFIIAAIQHCLNRELEAEEKARLTAFNPVTVNRRRQELQLENPLLRPSLPEQRRRMYLARGEHLKIS